MSLLNTLMFVGQTSQSTPPSARAYTIEHSPSLSVPQPVLKNHTALSTRISFDVKSVALLTGAFAAGVAGAYLLRSFKRSANDQPKGSNRSTNPYETPSLVHEYLMMHYHPLDQFIVHKDVSDMPKAALDFPAECARECIKWMKTVNQDGSDLRVLDVGCAVGRSSFELARFAGTVVGLDFSHAFIDAANSLKATSELPYRVKIEGDISEPAIARIHPDIDRSRCTFVQGDACALPSFEPFDCLLAANLVCRLPHPRKFLDSLPRLIKKGGFVVLFSPHTWLPDYTTKEEWLGGYYDSEGKPVRTGNSIIEHLTKDQSFRLVHQGNTPFFIRETVRKNQWTVSHLTVFQRL